MTGGRLKRVSKYIKKNGDLCLYERSIRYKLVAIKKIS